MWTAFPSSDYYADSATPRAQQPPSGLAEPPIARRARGASHVHRAPFDRVGSRLYPCSASGEQSQRLPGHQARAGLERPAVFKGAVVAAHSRCPPAWRLFCEMKGLQPPLRSRSAFRSCLHARGRLAVPPGRHVVGAAPTARCAIPHRGCPQLRRAAASARGRHPSRHGETLLLVLRLLSHGASWRTEEVAREGARGLLTEELAPAWAATPGRGRESGCEQEPPHRARRDADADLE